MVIYVGRQERTVAPRSFIGEVSLTPDPASVGLHPVRWLKPWTGRGDLPSWVAEELGRKVETRSRELMVHEVGGGVDDFSDDLMRAHDPREVFYSGLGQILSVNGRPVRR